LEQIEILSLFTASMSILKLSNLEKFLQAVLTSTPNLVHLKLDVRLMHINLVDVLSCPAVQSNLKNLELLEILKWDSETNNFRIANSRSIVPDDSWNDARDDEETLTGNMNMLTKSALKLARLEDFHLTNDPCSLSLWFRNHISISTLLQNNRETIQSLSIQLGKYCSCDHLKTRNFPRLKCFAATTINSNDQESLTLFLNNHLSSLEELDIAVNEEFTRSLIQVIKNISPSLKKLHLKAKTFTHDSHIRGREEEIDWSFLKGMSHLKDFKVVQTSKSNPRINENEYPKTLSIRACRVTPEGLLSCLRLPFLRRLDYLTMRPVSKSFVVDIAAQNPSLEVMSVYIESSDDDDPENVKYILKEMNHPRLRRLTNLVKKILKNN